MTDDERIARELANAHFDPDEWDSEVSREEIICDLLAIAREAITRGREQAAEAISEHFRGVTLTADECALLAEAIEAAKGRL